MSTLAGIVPGLFVSEGADTFPPAPVELGVTFIVPNEAALLLIDDTLYPTGARARVLTHLDDFDLLKTSTLTLAANMVLATQSGVGRWVRKLVPSSAWLYQTVWSVVPATGNDENVGSLASPIKTLAELFRRLTGATNVIVPIVDTDVFVTGTFPTTDPWVAEIQTTTVRFFVSAIPTVNFTGVVSAPVNLSIVAPGTTAKITSTWTVAPLVRKIVKDVTNNRWSSIQADLGGGQAKMSPWVTINETASQFSTAEGDTTNGATIEVYDLATFTGVCNVRYQGGDALATPLVCFQGIFFSGSDSVLQVVECIFQNCQFGSVRFTSGSIYCFNCTNLNGAPFIFGPSVQLRLFAGGWTNGWGNNSNSASIIVDVSNNTLFQGSTLNVNRRSVLRLRAVFFEGCPVCMLLEGDSLVKCSASSICGNGNGVAVSLGAGSRVENVGTAVSQWKLTTGATPLQFSGVSTCNAFDPATGLATTPRNLTFANIDATVALGGFGGAAFDLRNGCFFGASNV